MEFGKHLSKGIWGLADKALPVVYGVGYVMLVIRALPKEEFGNYVLVQEIFLIISGLTTALALQPLLKFYAEEGVNHKHVLSASLLLNLASTLLCALLVVVFRVPLSDVLKSPALAPLLMYIPVLLAASFIRNVALILLQTRFQVKEVFWTDFIHFIGVPLLIYIYSKLHLFNTAFDLIFINIITLASSSVLGFWLSRSMIRVTLFPNKEDVQRVLDYGKYSLGGVVSFLFTARADSFILSSFAGPVQVAVYNSVKVFTRIYDMVAQAVQMFILPATSKYSSQGNTVTLRTIVEKAILFSTVGMVPVFILFLVFASPLVGVVYGGKYAEGVPLLQIFSVLALIMPVVAVASTTLLGIGKTKVGFKIGVKILLISVALYFLCVPFLGALGATLGYVLSSIMLAVLATRELDKVLPISFVNVFRRTNDIKVFVQQRLLKSR